jgi:hypothetical protein
MSNGLALPDRRHGLAAPTHRFDRRAGWIGRTVIGAHSSCSKRDSPLKRFTCTLQIPSYSPARGDRSSSSAADNAFEPLFIFNLTFFY